MIFGVGTDIAKVSRFERWAADPELVARFFGERERISGPASKQRAAEHYAVRFAAKEAFAKALGTGFAGLTLADFWVEHSAGGAPLLVLGEATRSFAEARVGGPFRVHLSLSHEREFAVAFAVIEAAERPG